MSTSDLPPPTYYDYNQSRNGQMEQHNRPRLGFQEAMENFSTMFPGMDRSVIEAVLRACNGNIQETIDKLLGMTDSSVNGDVTDGNHEQTEQQPHSVVLHDASSQQRSSLNNTSSDRYTMAMLPVGKQSPRNSNITSSVSRYHPPLIGRLPDDFLRLATLSAASYRDPVAIQLLEDERLAKWLQNEEFMRQLQSDEDFVRSLETDSHNRNRRSRRHGSRHVTSHVPASAQYLPPPQLQPPQPQPPQLQSQSQVPEVRSWEQHSTSGRQAEGTKVSENVASATQVAIREEDDSSKKKQSAAEFKEKVKNMGSVTREKFYQLASKFNRKKKSSSNRLLLDCDDFDEIECLPEPQYDAANTTDDQNNTDRISPSAETYSPSSEAFRVSPGKTSASANARPLNNEADRKLAMSGSSTTASTSTAKSAATTNLIDLSFDNN